MGSQVLRDAQVTKMKNFKHFNCSAVESVLTDLRYLATSLNHVEAILQGNNPWRTSFLFFYLHTLLSRLLPCHAMPHENIDLSGGGGALGQRLVANKI